MTPTLGAVATMARQVLLLGSGLATMALVSRALGVEEFGKYALANSLAFLLGTFLSLSLPAVIVHFMESMRRLGLAGELVGNGAAILAVSIFLLFTFGSALIGVFLPGEKRELLHVISIQLLVLVQMLMAALEGVILSVRKYSVYNVLALGAPSCMLVLVLLLADFSHEWQNFVMLNIVAIIIVLPFYAREVIKLRLGPLSVRNRALRNTYLGYGLKLWMANLATAAQYRIPYILIESLLGVRALGVYSLGMQFSEKLWIPGRSVAAILFPERSAQLGAKGCAAYRQGMSLILLNMAIVCVGVGVLYAVILTYQERLFGPGFEDLPNVILALGPGIVGWAGVTIVGAELAGRGRSGSNCLASVLALGGSTLGIFIGNAYGLIGVAVGVSGGYLIAGVASLIMYMKYCKA